MEEGQILNITMKPFLMREWAFIKETKKCIVVRKTFKKRYGEKNVPSGCYYVPKKTIESIKIIKK